MVNLHNWIDCPASQFTRVWAAPAITGMLVLGSIPDPLEITFQLYSVGLPHYLENTVEIGRATPVFVGSTSYCEFWVKPRGTAKILAIM